MADCIAAKIIAEIGAVMGNIKTTGGYSVTVGSVIYDYADPVKYTYPCVQILLTDYDIAELSNKEQVIKISVKILGYMKIATRDDKTIAGAKSIMEFAADIRTALLTMYSRQQAGTFSLANFEILEGIKQSLFTLDTPSNVAGVYTELNCQFNAGFTER